MSIPGDNSEARAIPERDDAADLVRCAIVNIRVWGRLTKREPEAEGLSIAILHATDKR